MLTRIITAVVGLIVFIGVIMLGETALSVAISAVTLFMMYEVFGAITKSKTVKVSGYISGVLLVVGIFFNQFEIALAAMVISAMVFLIFLHGEIEYREIFSVQFMALYIGLFMSYIPRIRSELGLAAMALIFIIAWGSDTAAYFCGTFFGKHKLIPKVSPKKTIEGSVGAVIITAVLCALYVFIMDRLSYPVMGEAASVGVCVKFGVIGFVTSALSQLGDLAASAIKRDAGIKDYGRIFPGHGGFMDRFDSVIFISPVVYYLCSFIIM